MAIGKTIDFRSAEGMDVGTKPETGAKCLNYVVPDWKNSVVEKEFSGYGIIRIVYLEIH